MARSKTKAADIASVSLMAAIIAVCSWITIPIGSIPVTFQTFAVCTSVGILGMKKGAASVILYLLLGAAGLPVFAGFQGGIGVLAGPTGGYAIGFVLLALLSGVIIEKAGRKIFVMMIAFLVGMAVCYIFGTVWFVKIYSDGSVGFLSALSVCVLPYIIPDLIKISLAAVVSRSVSERIKI